MLNLSTDKYYKKYFSDEKNILINSDKKFIQDILHIKKEDKDFISFKSILNHIKTIPSVRRFNILNKLFNFKKFNDEEKSKIISICFLSGKGTLFQRSLDFLSDNVLNLLSIQLEKDCSYNILNNNVSHNIKLLKNFLPEEKFDLMYSSLFKSLKTTNINSLFCPHINLKKEDQRNLTNLLIKKIYNSINYDRRHNIDINSSDFIDFYIKNILGNNYNHLLNDIIIGSKKNIIPFINNIYKEKKHFDSLYNENIDVSNDLFFQQMIIYFFNYPDNNKKINSFNKYFKIILLAEESIFFKKMKDIGVFMEENKHFYKKNDIIYFKKIFIETLNSRINNSNLIIENDESKNYDCIINQYNINKEKVLITKSLLNIAQCNNYIKRL